ncbi:YckD family protein [Priestia megaterium]
MFAKDYDKCSSSFFIYERDACISRKQSSARNKMTSQQKQELSVLYKEMLAKKKEILSKYVEYGVLSKTESQNISSHMENRYQHMEKNGFVPKRHCHKMHHSK